MKKAGPTIKYLDTGIFHHTILFTCSMNREQITKSLKKVDGWSQAFQSVDPNLFKSPGFVSHKILVNTRTKAEVHYMFMCLRDFQFDDNSYIILSHEVVHLCQYILPDYLDRNAEQEAEAYLHSHLMEQALNAMRNPK